MHSAFLFCFAVGYPAYMDSIVVFQCVPVYSQYLYNLAIYNCETNFKHIILLTLPVLSSCRILFWPEQSKVFALALV